MTTASVIRESKAHQNDASGLSGIIRLDQGSTKSRPATNSSSHGLVTPLLEAAFNLLERAHALTLEMSLASDGIHRRSGEPVLNLQPVPHDALE